MQIINYEIQLMLLTVVKCIQVTWVIVICEHWEPSLSGVDGF